MVVELWSVMRGLADEGSRIDGVDENIGAAVVDMGFVVTEVKTGLCGVCCRECPSAVGLFERELNVSDVEWCLVKVYMQIQQYKKPTRAIATKCEHLAFCSGQLPVLQPSC